MDDEAEVAADTKELSEEAKQILLEGAQCEENAIMATLDRGGYSVQTNGKTFVPNNAREAANLRAAIEELESYGMIRDMGKGVVYELTKLGYEMADTLKVANESQKPVPEPNYSDTDLENMLHAWFGKQGFKGGTETIILAPVDAALNIPPGSTKRLLANAMKDYNYVPVPESIGDKSMRIRYVAPASSAPFVSNPGDTPSNPYRHR